MKYFKLIAKIFAIFFTVCAIGLAALAWRVQQAPLDLKFLLSYWHTKDAVLEVDKIELEKSAFYKLPQINIQNLRYKTPTIEVTCQYIRGRWQIWDVLLGKLSLSSLILFKPKITVYLQDTANQTEDINYLKIVQNLPFSNLNVIDGELVVIPADPSIVPVTVNRLNLNIDHRSRLSNWDLSGLLFQKFPLSGAGSFHHRALNATASLKLKEAKIQDFAAYTKSIQEYLPLFGEEVWDVELASRFSATTDATITLVPVKAPSQSYSARILRTPSKPIELTLKLPTLNVSHLEKQWPASLAPEARAWILKNISKGEISSTIINLHLSPEDYAVKNINVTANLKDTHIHVWDRLPLLHIRTAEVKFADETLTAHLHQGDLGGALLENGHIQLSDKMENLDIKTLIKGDILPALKILDSLKIQHPLVTNQAKGLLNLKLHLGLNLQKPEDIKIEMQGNLENLSGALKLSQHTFSFNNGEFNLGFSNDAFTLKGSTLLADRPIQISLHKDKPMGDQSGMSYELHGQVESKVAKAFLPSWLQDILQEGVIALDLKSTLTPQQEQVLSLVANLKMIALNVAPLGWKKLRNTEANLALEMHTKDNVLSIPKLQLESPSLILGGDLSLKDNNIESLNLKAILKDKQHLTISTTQNAKGLLFVVDSTFLDARPLLKYHLEDKDPQKKKEDSKTDTTEISSAYQIEAHIRNIILEKGIQIPILKGKIIYNGKHFEHIDLSANSNKGGHLSVTLKPKDNNSVLDVKATKLDDFIRGCNLDKKVTIENLTIVANRPLKQLDKPYEGKITLEKIHVYNAPLIGRMLAIMSLESLVSQLGGKGILFILGEGEFGFLNNKLTIHRSAITSTALGLSFEGTVDFKNKILNLDGAAVPANVLNKMIGNIPLLGTILTGGDKDKGVFSSSYKITGSFDNPEVKSNPLGVVVPNMVKKLFGGLTGSHVKAA